MSEVQIQNIQGLTTTKAKELQAQFGKNELVSEKRMGFYVNFSLLLVNPCFCCLLRRL
ncbi:hypothetical protein SOV_33210 [Sporomusa ovata DSM 2662]|uniref:cation-transporting P-type ATPase n=1 Tax=Sporomusa ovata TaxID=2378 RepID=UPI000388704B|nr:cation transporter/ATPase [Sporomusa ovata DSM 2662]